MAETPSLSTRILHAGFHLPECPRWHDGRLHFSDMYGQAVFALDEEGALERLCTVAGRPGGIGVSADGALLINEMETARILRLGRGGDLSVHADLSALVDSINDMVSTPDGHCFVGRLTMAPPFDPAPLIAVDPSGRSRIAAKEAIAVANGMVMRADDTLIVAESVTGRLLAYDVGPDRTLRNYRIFADLPDGLNPDGICGDDAGGVWIASPHAGQFYRVIEGGAVTHRIKLEEGRLAYACAIGGSDGKSLFLCTSGPYEPEIVSKATAGRIEIAASPYPATTTFP